jgi:hypothetical protein
MNKSYKATDISKIQKGDISKGLAAHSSSPKKYTKNISFSVHLN